MNDIASAEYYSRLIRLEQLRTRCARLERALAVLLVALILLIALAALGGATAAGSEVPVMTTSAIGKHGSYCLWGDGERLFYADNRAQTNSIRKFQNSCERTGGELLWRP